MNGRPIRSDRGNLVEETSVTCPGLSVYVAAAGDVSFRPNPYVAKWGPRVGERAAKLQWFTRAGPIFVGGPALLIGLTCFAVGMGSVGTGILAIGTVVSAAGFVCLRMSVSAMSKFFGKSLTLRSSPVLSDDGFMLWCQRNDIPTEHNSI